LKQVREKSVGNIYRDDKRNQAYEGYNGVWADLFLWGMRPGVKPS
jgi:hypothetical protein